MAERMTTLLPVLGICQVKNRSTCLYKRNQQFIEENLLPLQANKTMLKVSGILSDTEYAIIARPKSVVHKKRVPANVTEGLSAIATLRDEAIILDYLRYLHHFEDDYMAKVLQKGGGMPTITQTFTSR